MTYRSESRGLMYTAPPSGDDSERATRDAESEAEDETERESPVLAETTGTTDANWTGTVPADD